VAAWLPSLGGYGEYALAENSAVKHPNVTWNAAAALPASVEAAVGVLRQLRVARGETLLILGAAGSVGTIARQLAIRQGLNVIGAVAARDDVLIRELGATPVRYGKDLLTNVRKVADRVDATFDAAGKGGLEDAIELAGGAERVITLADEHAAELGVRLSAPTPIELPTPSNLACGCSRPANCACRRSGRYRCRRQPKRSRCWRADRSTTSCCSWREW
jgi:NADPH:quinone reductase-like Zn-dependent oxidoreductase